MAEDWKIQVSLKNDSGALLNVRGQNVAEVEESLGQVFDDAATAKRALATFLTAVPGTTPEQIIKQAFPGTEVVSETPTQAATPAQMQPPVAQAAPAPAPQQPAGPKCDVCGESKEYVPPGVSKKTGKPYKGFYSCPNNRDAQHQAA